MSLPACLFLLTSHSGAIDGMPSVNMDFLVFSRWGARSTALRHHLSFDCDNVWNRFFGSFSSSLDVHCCMRARSLAVLNLTREMAGLSSWINMFVPLGSFSFILVEIAKRFNFFVVLLRHISASSARDSMVKTGCLRSLQSIFWFNLLPWGDPHQRRH